MATSLALSENFRTFPGFEVDFFSHDGFLVPVQRDIIAPTAASAYTLILSPGRVWAEKEDNGWSRAAFPFVLSTQTNNQAHNGLATFVFNDTSCSQLRIQIVQETTPWLIFDAWAQTPMIYKPGPSSDYDLARAAFEAERARRFPVRPWSDLEKDGINLSSFDGSVPAEEISTRGIVLDGVLYLPPFQTRHGVFPFPDYMRSGAFSVTKSIGASIALFRLAQKYGPQVFDLRIVDYLNVTANHNGWQDVTFGNCLDMATGIGDVAPDPNQLLVFADENQSRMDSWSRMVSLQGKLDVCFSYGNYPWGPNEIVRYNTTHTFVLAAAMDAFYKSKEGEHAELWDMVRHEVYEPIGIAHAPMMHTVEADGAHGVPFFGVGAFPTPDDLAKLTTLLQNHGRYGEQQLLHEASVIRGLYQDPEQGLSLGVYTSAGDSYRYSWSYWSQPWRSNERCFQQIPYMLGYGGNIVILMPNGMSGFRFADQFDYNVEGMIQAMQQIRPLCDQ